MTEYHFPLKPANSLIFLNGEESDCSLIKNQIPHYENVIIADGAWDKLQKSTIAKHLLAHLGKKVIVMGDGDSIINRPSIFIETSNKNYTDFEKIVMHMLTLSIDFADIYWANGGEVDHFLGNLSVSAKYHDKIKLRFFDDTHTYFYLNQSCRISAAKDKKLSIYPFPECTINSSGLKYELKQMQLTQKNQQSLRNQIIAESVTVQLQGSAFIFIEN